MRRSTVLHSITNGPSGGPTKSDTLVTLDIADVHLSHLSAGASEAEKRLRSRIAAHLAQLEKLRMQERPARASRRAAERIAVRVAELTDALLDVEQRQLAGFRDALAEARSCVVRAKQSARVDVVLADELRRRHDDEIRSRSRDLFAVAGGLR